MNKGGEPNQASGPKGNALQLPKLSSSLRKRGFLVIGSIPLDRQDTELGANYQALVLIGSSGPKLWPRFRTSAEYADGLADPLDRYTRRHLERIGTLYDLHTLFPFDGPPYHPFQQWAIKCGGFSQSPLGVLVHAEFGPWAAFRGAFLSKEPLSPQTRETAPGLCDTCPDKPCLAACPAKAISIGAGYNVPKCLDHLASGPTAPCWSGCLARRACPFGQEHQQAPENARFHMESFAGLAS